MNSHLPALTSPPLTSDFSPSKLADSLRYLIGGNPCGATHFMAAFLTRSGLRTSHEAFFVEGGELKRNPHGSRESANGKVERIPEDWLPEAECSYTVSEWFHNKDVAHLPVIALIRDPWKVLNSYIRYGFFEGRPIDVEVRMARVLLRWNNLLRSPRLAFVCHVERDLDTLCDYLGLTPASTEGIYAFPHNRDKVLLAPDDYRRYPSYEPMKAFAQEHGYA